MARIRMEPGTSDLAIERNFQRLENASEAALDIVRGRVTFTGSIVVTTGLSRIDSVVASFTSAPAAGACFLVAYPYSAAGGPPNQLVLATYTNAFATGVASATLEWIAVGEMILG